MHPNPAAQAIKFIRETIQLRDGRRVVLRPIRTTDAELLIDLHAQLSQESQYLRFFGPKPRLTRAEAEYLASVDYHRRFAIVAVEQTDEGDERIVAVGRFDIGPDNVAEPAIVVRDDYQGARLGTAILERMLEVARGRGVEKFSAEILAENDRMIQILRGNGLNVTTPEDGVVRVTAPVEDIPPLLRALGLVARSTSMIRERTASLRRRKPEASEE